MAFLGYTVPEMKPGKYDRTHPFRITGAERREFETPHRRPPTNPRIGPPPCSELNRARVRSLRTVGIWNISWTFLSMVLDDRNRYPSADQAILAPQTRPSSFQHAYAPSSLKRHAPLT